MLLMPKKKDSESEVVQAELNRYNSFYERYLSHQSTGKHAEEKREKVEKSSLEYRQKTNFDPSFLTEALDLLVSCRHTLKYFYVYQFYHDSDSSKDLTLEQRNLAEHFTELLSDLLFPPSQKLDDIDRDKLKNHISVTKKYLQGLVDCIETRT